MLTFEGECVGNLLRYCSDGAIVEEDCPTEYTMNSVCMELDPVYGYGCAVAVGEQCYYEDEAGDIIVVACQGTEPGCVENASTAVCTENTGQCTESEVDTCNAQGGLIVLCTDFKQPNIIDCVSLGGECMPGRCANVPAAGYCDDVYVFCASDLECSQDGVCAPPVPPGTGDAGVKDASSSGLVDVNTPSRPDVGSGFPDSGANESTFGGGQRTTKSTAQCSCEAISGTDSASVHGMVILLLGFLFKTRRRRPCS